MRRLSGREGSHQNASAPHLFPFLSVARAWGGLGGCNGSAFANTAAFQTDVCMHSHSGQQKANNKPSFCDVQPEVDHRPWGWGWLGVTPAATHTCTYACHFHLGFCVTSSCHPFIFPPFLFTSSSLRFSFFPSFFDKLMLP